VSVTNNYALNFHIPMPLHMIFRAGSLMANMIMGIILLGKFNLEKVGHRGLLFSLFLEGKIWTAAIFE
jgi:hypothetical protein